MSNTDEQKQFLQVHLAVSQNIFTAPVRLSFLMCMSYSSAQAALRRARQHCVRCRTQYGLHVWQMKVCTKYMGGRRDAGPPDFVAMALSWKPKK